MCVSSCLCVSVLECVCLGVLVWVLFSFLYVSVCVMVCGCELVIVCF